jgi:hypothetical protein
MEQSILFTQDKRELEVFFLKPQQPPKELLIEGVDDFQPLMNEPNTWIVNDPEIAQALIDDNKDCCEELKEELDDDLYLMGEQDVNENSAGGGAHGCGPCPVGHKGHQGSVGIKDDEYETFKAISECLEKFNATSLDINDSDSRDILSITITRKVKDL